MTPALSSVGTDSQFIAELFHWITVGAAVIWVAALAFLVYCLRSAPRTAMPRGRASVVQMTGRRPLLATLVRSRVG